MRNIRMLLIGLLLLAVCYGAFAADPVKIAYLTVILNHPYWRAQSVTVDELAKKQGVQLSILDAGNDAIKQASQVDSVILQKPNAVIFSAVDTGAGASLVAKMKAAGIPVVVNNRPIPGANYDIQIVIDPVLMGKQSAEAFVNFAKARYGKAKGNFLEIQGQLSDDNVSIVGKRL